MTVFLDILVNLVFISFLGLGFFLVGHWRSKLGKYSYQALLGLCFGLVAFVVTSAPVHLGDGATVDARAGPVLLAGIFAGPIGAVIAAGLGALARGIVGGSFAPAGMVVFIVYASIGLLFGHLRFFDRSRICSVKTIALLSMASCFGASAMFFMIQPFERAVIWAQNDLPLIFVANTLSVSISILVIALSAGILRQMAVVADYANTMGLAKNAGQFGSWDLDVASGRLHWDDNSSEMLGFGPSEYTGTLDDWAKRVHPDDLDDAMDSFNTNLETNFDPEKPMSSEFRILHPDGDIRMIKGAAIVVREKDGQPKRVVGANLDITKLRLAEAELYEARIGAEKSQKLELIGQLTGGVAHDFNNLLAVILGNQELLREETHDSKKLAFIDSTIHATERGAALTRSMLSFASRAPLTPEHIDLNQTLDEVTVWTHRTIPSDIEIKKIKQEEIWTIKADQASAETAILNLIANARDAMVKGGRMTFETQNVQITEAGVRLDPNALSVGRYVTLSVADTGTGISPEDLPRVFEPFFTTKDIGKGSGLGLSMVQGFMGQSGGTVRARSILGEGAEFKLYFPAVDLKTKPVSGAEKITQENRHSVRILIAEDNIEVRDVMVAMLRKEGHEVVAAQSGDEAFEIFKKDRDIDLILTDVMMPGRLKGTDLAEKIQDLDPDLPVILMSGYADIISSDAMPWPEQFRLMKPVSRDLLVSTINAALPR